MEDGDSLDEETEAAWRWLFETEPMLIRAAREQFIKQFFERVIPNPKGKECASAGRVAMMIEPSAEAREQAERIFSQMEQVGLLYVTGGVARDTHVRIIAGALAEKDAALAGAQRVCTLQRAALSIWTTAHPHESNPTVCHLSRLDRQSPAVRVLRLLGDGEISVGKACEALNEIGLGLNPILPPSDDDARDWDDATSFREKLVALQADLAAMRELLEEQRDLWGFVLPDLDDLDNRMMRVRFPSLWAWR